MSHNYKHSVLPEIARNALLNPQQYAQMYQQSVDDPAAFWAEQGKILDWITPYQQVKNTSFTPGDIRIRWYEDGTLNLAANCIDRHLATQADKIAIIHESDDGSKSRTLTYRQLHEQVCRAANMLTTLGISKGDVVAIYMPMVPRLFHVPSMLTFVVFNDITRR